MYMCVCKCMNVYVCMYVYVNVKEDMFGSVCNVCISCQYNINCTNSVYVAHYVLPLSLMCLYFLVLLCLLSVFMCVLPYVYFFCWGGLVVTLFAYISDISSNMLIPVNPPPFRGSLPRKSLISRMDWVSCAGDINLPHTPFSSRTTSPQQKNQVQ